MQDKLELERVFLALKGALDLLRTQGKTALGALFLLTKAALERVPPLLKAMWDLHYRMDKVMSGQRRTLGKVMLGMQSGAETNPILMTASMIM